MKPMIVGQAPAHNKSEQGPLSGHGGQRIARLCGITMREYLRSFERVNLLPAFPGNSGKGDAFPLEDGRKAWSKLRPRLRGRRVVLLGQNVARAAGFAYGQLPLFAWRKGYLDDDSEVAICPHPSGINQWWNDALNVHHAEKFWQALVKEMK